MLKVLLVDDEPFIVQGLSQLIDWEKENYEIAATAQNGREALAYLRSNKVDLIIADIKMPEMTGLELLETIRREKVSDAYFVILSGYGEFSYAQQAIRYSCMDYVLKPVEKEVLTEVIRRAANMSEAEIQRQENKRQMERAYLARNVISLLLGKYDDMNLQYVSNHMQLSNGVRYIDIQLVDVSDPEDVEDMEMRSMQRKLYQSCREFLKEDEAHCILDVSAEENVYDVGLIYCDYMAAKNNFTEKVYLEKLFNYLSVALKQKLVMMVGKRVADIAAVSKSYGTACMLNSLQAFHDRKNIYYYEEEIHVNSDGILLCKTELDNLISAIEQNDKLRIHESVDKLYEELRRLVIILLDNACKYCGPGGTVTVTLTRGERAVLTVHNTGEPISAEAQPHLFERFYRADSSRARSTGGYGIGLSTARAIVTRHKGRIFNHYTDGIITFTAVIPQVS